MPTKWSRTLIPTSRQVPSEAEVPSHQLMIRAGFIRKLGSGLYDYLPLGWRALYKTMAIVREEMNRAGAIEIFLPALQPIELWEKSGRRADYGDNLFVVKDQHGREQALGPTHEEVVTELVGAYVESYRQLPLTLYQIQTKFRDEYRPRFGILRSREFQMKDAYSFDVDGAGLDRSYQAMFEAYCRIFDRCGLSYEIVEAESGPIGGSASHEFMVPSSTGEDTILKSDKSSSGGYAANVEKCAIGHRGHSFDGPPTGDLAKVHTPDSATIEDVCHFMKVKPNHMLKTLVCYAVKRASPGVARSGDRATALGADDGHRSAREFERLAQSEDVRFIVAVVRGDHELNESKLRQATQSLWAEFDAGGLLDEYIAREIGFAIGYVGPHVIAGRDDVWLIVDPNAAQEEFWASGANELDHHVKHFNWKRDVLDPLGDAAGERVFVADVRNAVDGDPSPDNDGGILRETRGIEIGHVFKLGDKYSKAMRVEILNERNERQPIIMGCYGIGVNRILAAAIEREGGHDSNGIIWPATIAPYAVLITPIKYDGPIREKADRLATQIESAGRDVLIDDRPERPGVKFKDADLIGIPLRITIGDKALRDGKVEIKPRTCDKAELIPVAEAAQKTLELVESL